LCDVEIMPLICPTCQILAAGGLPAAAIMNIRRSI
jgi:hypothetical protein